MSGGVSGGMSGAMSGNIPVTTSMSGIPAPSAAPSIPAPSTSSDPSDKRKIDSIPDASLPPPKKPNHYGAYLAKQQSKTGPANPGSKELPVGKPDCLLGLTFVFTGELSSISREDSANLVLKYGMIN